MALIEADMVAMITASLHPVIVIIIFAFMELV